MEGIYFYWIAWIAWIYVTFLLEKSKTRIMTAVSLMIVIIFSSTQIQIGHLYFNSAMLFCLFISYYFISKKKTTFIFYYFTVSLMLTISYVTFKLFQLYDPVWVMFHPTIKLSVILLVLLLLLVKEQALRVALACITIVQGELITTLFLSNMQNVLVVGQNESLDILAITTFMTFLWYSFERFVLFLDEFVKQRTVLKASKR